MGQSDAEASKERRSVVAAVVDEIVRRASGLGHPVRVGIDGRSTAGKTHLADELSVELRARGIEAARSSIDHFHRPGHKFRSQRGEWTPETRLSDGLDYPAFRDLVLLPLQDGGSRRIRPRLWDSFFDQPFPEEWFDLSPDAVLVSDAGFGFVPELVGHWDFRIWLDISESTMVERAGERDGVWPSSPERARSHYESFWARVDSHYEAQCRPREAADWVIDNSDFGRPGILRMSVARLSGGPAGTQRVCCRPLGRGYPPFPD